MQCDSPTLLSTKHKIFVYFIVMLQALFKSYSEIPLHGRKSLQNNACTHFTSLDVVTRPLWSDILNSMKCVHYEHIQLNTFSLCMLEHQILNSITELQISFLPHGNWTCEMQEIPIHSFARTKIYLLNSACHLTIGNALSYKEYYSASHRFSFLSVSVYMLKFFIESKVKEGCVWRTMRHLSILFSSFWSLFIYLSYLASTSS